MILKDFPLVSFDKIRYSDTDRQGHVNNAVFSTYLETGRVELLFDPQYPVLGEDTSFVIASLKLDYLNEIKWPGQVDIGTGIRKIGNSSVVFAQALFQNDLCVAKAETVIVQVHNAQKGSFPLSEASKNALSRWLLREG